MMVRAICAAIGVISLVAVPGCHQKPAEGPAEAAGRNIDESAEDVEEGAEEATEEAGEALEEAGDEIEEVTKDED